MDGWWRGRAARGRRTHAAALPRLPPAHTAAGTRHRLFLRRDMENGRHSAGMVVIRDGCYTRAHAVALPLLPPTYSVLYYLLLRPCRAVPSYIDYRHCRARILKAMVTCAARATKRPPGADGPGRCRWPRDPVLSNYLPRDVPLQRITLPCHTPTFGGTRFCGSATLPFLENYPPPPRCRLCLIALFINSS